MRCLGSALEPAAGQRACGGHGERAWPCVCSSSCLGLGGGWQEGWREGAFPVPSFLELRLAVFLFPFQMHFKMYGILSQASSCCLVTALEPEVSSRRPVHVLEQGPELRKPARGGEGLVWSSGS